MIGRKLFKKKEKKRGGGVFFIKKKKERTKKARKRKDVLRLREVVFEMLGVCHGLAMVGGLFRPSQEALAPRVAAGLSCLLDNGISA